MSLNSTQHWFLLISFYLLSSISLQGPYRALRNWFSLKTDSKLLSQRQVHRSSKKVWQINFSANNLPLIKKTQISQSQQYWQQLQQLPHQQQQQQGRQKSKYWFNQTQNGLMQFVAAVAETCSWNHLKFLVAQKFRLKIEVFESNWICLTIKISCL